ncbi:X-Pro dipeptidyl-peptidase C-terminal domain protein [Luminiphilus syltensis NOR5-1B]|uniref:X-Pro dipeptidyl-peptidase C-terminal domain protein n=2 Tax=Luminiphilus TaxID=1341118 RepID=B8KY34_9GAMM|nr:X-Pro dipeptidyl-peptidase C-terminal domain protein [Luminiphilus syltensis NOR5-1B]
MLTLTARLGMADTSYAVTTVEDLREQFLAKVTAHRKLNVEMRDGVHLSTDVYIPKNTTGKIPAILNRLPYDYDPLPAFRLAWMMKAIDRGYAVILQNERGLFFSEGDYEILGRPQKDGSDMLDWIAEQEWSNGKVGLYGCSSSAEWQLALSATDHPALAAIVPAGAGAGIGAVGPYTEHGNLYRGGAVQLLFSAWMYDYMQPGMRPLFPAATTPELREKISKWYDLSPSVPPADWGEVFKTLPISKINDEAGMASATWEELINRDPSSGEWRQGGLFYADTMQINTPALWLNSWFDISVGPNLALFNHARQNSKRASSEAQYAVVGPNLHCNFFDDDVGEVGDREFANADIGAYDLILDFFDHFMKGESNGFNRNVPPVQYYDMGNEIWVESESWPPTDAEPHVFYLESGEGANSLFGDGVLQRKTPADGSDSFTFDPMNPVPSVGGDACCMGPDYKDGMRDQRAVEARADVLVYTSEPLEHDLKVAGEVNVTLYVSSDAADTDFTIKLVDVFPDGAAYNIDENIQRVSWRDGYEAQAPAMSEGEVYRVTFAPMNTANTFKQGHRIRVEVSSSNFPRFSRNMNTMTPHYEQEDPFVARNSVYFGEKYPSQVLFDVRGGRTTAHERVYGWQVLGLNSSL